MQPTRLAAAQASARRFLAGLPDKYRVAVVAFSSRAQVVAPADADREFANAGARRAPVGRGDGARRRARDRRRVARTPQGEKLQTARPPPAAILVISDGAQDGGASRWPGDRARARGQGARSTRRCSGRRTASSRCRSSGGFVQRIQVPPDPDALRRSPSRRAAVLRGARPRSSSAPSTTNWSRGSARRRRTRRSPSRSPGPARSCCSGAARSPRSGSGGSRDPGRPGRSLAAAAARRSRAPSARAADECRGLTVCIPVAGPWVAIPPPRGAPRPRRWQLACPQGIVGGVDARASEPRGRRRVPRPDREPREPGDHDPRVAALQGHLRGTCAQGHELPAVHRVHPGWRRRTAHARPFTAPAPSNRACRSRLRVDDAPVAAGPLARATLACRPGERLLAAAHSVGLYTAAYRPPGSSRAVHVVRGRATARRCSSARRGAACRPAYAPRCRFRRSARGEVRLAPRSARATAGTARRARLPRDRAPESALRDPLHEIEVLASVTGRSRAGAVHPAAGRAAGPDFALAAIARPEVRMSVASEQASIALTVDTSGSMLRMTSSRRDSVPPRGRSAASSTRSRRSTASGS